MFFPDTPDLPAPIQPPSLAIAILPGEDLSGSPLPSESFADFIMSGLDEKVRSLKTLCRRITANMDTNPVSILNMAEMIPLYKESEKKLVDLLVDLSVGAQEIFEEHTVELGDTKINLWKVKLQTFQNNSFKYREELAAAVSNVRQADAASLVDNPASYLSQTRANNSSTNSTLEQERLDLVRQNQLKLEAKIRTEAESRLIAVVEDTKRFAKKFPPMAESWTLEPNLKIEMAMKEINNWEKQMNNLVKESREVEILVRGNNLADLEDNVSTMKQFVSNSRELMDNTIKHVQYLDTSRNLSSLGTRKSELIKFPEFSGKAGEDFVTFKRQTEKAFNSNRVPTDEQV